MLAAGRVVDPAEERACSVEVSRVPSPSGSSWTVVSDTETCSP
jgi:hypothetical protein